MTARPFAAALISLLIAAQTASAGFRKDVAPILVGRCLGCHDDKKPSNGLNLSTFAKLKRGGKASGAEILVPGDPVGSALFASVLPTAKPRMPLKALPLTDDETRVLETWIKEGAKFDGPDPDAGLASLVDPLAGLPKIATRANVSEPVVSLAFEPRSGTLAAAVGREILLFDAKTGSEVGRLGPHVGPLSFVRFTPDGRSIVAAGGRAGMFGSLVVWDFATKTRKTETRGHADAILAADVSSDGKRVVTAGYDRMVKLWDLDAGRELRTLKEHTDAVLAVAFSPDGRLVASGGADRTVKLWRTADGARLVSLSDSAAEVYALAFSPDGGTLFAGGVDRSIRSWTIKGETAETARATFAHDGPILRLLTSGDRLYSTGEDKSIRVWERATLKPIVAWPNQPDWVYALALDASGPAVGRYDGSIARLDPNDGRIMKTLREAPKPKPLAAAPKPELVRPATLNPVAPRGLLRGKTTRLALTGQGVGRAHRILLPDLEATATIVPTAKPAPDRLDVDLAIPAGAKLGVHRIGVQTPLGIPAYQPFVVEAAPETPEKEPNDRASEATYISHEMPDSDRSYLRMNTVLNGTIAKPGDVDRFVFVTTVAGSPVLLTTRTKSLGSALSMRITVRDDSGRVVAEGRSSADAPEPAFHFNSGPGACTVTVEDLDYAGSANHFYRVRLSELTVMDSDIQPLGVEIGTTGRLRIENGLQTLPGFRPTPKQAVVPGEIVRILDESLGTHSVVVDHGRQRVEAEGPDLPEKAELCDAPGGMTGRIGRPGDVDFFKFPAKRGERRIVEVYGRRLGSPIDPAIEILDAKGNPVPRAVLRPVEQTNVAFRDHNSASRAIRLTTWDRLSIGDYLLVGREVMRLSELPRNPDDDAIFWGLGGTRLNAGERIAFLETTPEQHPMSQPMYKVEIHPPGATFPSGGVAPVTLHYRNDDGGPGFGKDARLTFDPPADGDYVVRVEDVRGSGGRDHAYHLLIRDPKPDFALSVATENPNVPRGGSSIVAVNIERIDGYEGPVDVEVEALPPGLSAIAARIEPGAYSADLLLTADESAPAFSPPTWRLKATAPGLASKSLDPGGPSAGWITVAPKADLSVEPSVRALTIRPGERVETTLSVDRGPAFSGRVPIDVRNLPAGVRVLNIGLNGVLVTESESKRSIFLYAEPWVAPMSRPFYAVGRVESTGQTASSPPITLTVLPAAP